ncbi:MAG: hypothetical protein O9302_13375 [Cyclobacteriaceae bacterium]|nr:hypothetical protein [Cytophagales bacterium]MCZ8329051.1 hypothetical protein [Cyclobacteriaceae bacterium]
MKVRIVILIFSVFCMASYCKQDCDNLDKEEIKIALLTGIIDSIEIKTPINFIISNPKPDFISYSSGLINTEIENLVIEVYIGNSVTQLEIPIKEDSYLRIVITHSSKSECNFENVDTINDWQTFTLNDVTYCYYHRVNDC